ncbi:MAG: class III signal peptide-containing protein [Methanobrevibacter sp.]|nr:class III signal peptide-containing protein [Methanobrevibacter sp.]
MILKEFKKIIRDEKIFNIMELDENGQAGAEMILLIGGMIVIVLIATYFYKDYLLGIGEEMNSTEIAKVNNSIENISSKFD